MSDIFKKKLLERALNKNLKFMYPEKDDPRIKQSISKLRNLGFNIIDIETLDVNKYLSLAKLKKFTKNWTDDMILDYLNDSLNLSIFALDNDDIDCVIAGSQYKTADVIRSAIRIVGLKEKNKWISSIFIMLAPDNKKIFTFADCGVIPEPTSEQLCSIAYEASFMHELISKEKPKVAFLSFSTKGSAKHYKVKKIQDAAEMFKLKYPEIISEGEIQFDVAINQSIAQKKVNNSVLKGDANVFIFPDLDSANIAYKITQHLAGYQALGPILIGLKKPINDLSRGCSIDDIVYVSAISALQK